jgi:CRP/FNR family transcriptional regulator
MVKKRRGLNIHCKHCPVGSLCIANSLSPLEVQKVNEIITHIHFINPGEHLYFQNQKVQYLFAVYSGCCKEYAVDKEGIEKINNFYFPGEILGLESLSSGKYFFSALALETSRLCAIPVDLFFEQMTQSPALMNRFVHLISEKLNRQIPVTTNAKRRIASFLLDILYRLNAKETKEEDEHIHLPMSQSDIGNLLGLAHETVSRTFHGFQNKHIIKMLNKKIYITDMTSLKSIANYSELPETKDNVLVH